MIKTPLNLAMLGDPEAQQFCEMLSLSAIFSPLTDGGCGPTGVVLAVDSVRITFPTCVDIVAATGIEVNIGGAGWEAVASVSGGADRIWEFATTTEIAEGDVVLWQYLGAEESIVDCTEAVDVGVLDPVTVRNPLELTEPTLVSAEVGNVDDSTFVIVFSEDLASADFSAGWSIEADATPLTITGATESPAGTLTITVSEDVYTGQTVTISYDADAGDIADITGYPTANVLASITDEAVTNNSTTGNEVTLASIAVTPDAGTINYGTTQQFTATGTYSDSSTADITGDVTWDSSDDAVATITAGGLATGAGVGTATISATLGVVSGDTTLAIAWTPALLFLASEPGFILDPSDLSTMFEDSAGTTAISVFGKRVGRINDISGNGNHFGVAEANRTLLVDSANPRLLIDGLDFHLASLAAVDFTGTPAVTVIASVRKETDSATAIVFEASTNGYSTSGGWYVSAPNTSGGLQDYGFAAKGTSAAFVTYQNAAMSAPVSNAVVGRFDISQSTLAAELRGLIDGVEYTRTTSGTSLGTGNFGNHTIYLGARAGTTFELMDGTVGRSIVIGRALTDQECADASAWVGNVSNTVVAVVGDSTATDYAGANRLTLHCGFSGRNLAVAGDTIEEQETVWTNRTDKADFDVVVVQIGLNDLDPAEGASVAVARLQSLIDTINADVSVPIYISQMIPCRSRLITLYGAINGPIAYQKWLDMNAAIAGSGDTPITGVDSRITSHVALMNDGNGNLLAAYDTGDHIHPNDLGRAVNATAWTTAMADDL